MNRRTLVVAAVVALITASAHAADPARTRESALPLEERRPELRALFDRAPGVISEGANGITVGAFAVNVIVARIDTGGKLVSACVDNEAAARRFLDAPIEKIDTRQAKEH